MPLGVVAKSGGSLHRRLHARRFGTGSGKSPQAHPGHDWVERVSAPPPTALSKNHINKCGNLLRDYISGVEPEPSAVDLEHAIDVVTEFRGLHAYPMTKIRMGLTSMVRTVEIDAAITQRHKRVPRIIRKLCRMEKTSLARLEDIAGCRVVVDSPADSEALCKRIRRNWLSAFAREPRDYVANPKDIGYRAIHFVVRRDGRAVEVQVRTRAQQQWAEAVEAMDARRNLNLKDGVGPSELIEYFSTAGQVLHHREYDLPMSSDLVDQMRAAQEAVISAGYYTARS